MAGNKKYLAIGLALALAIPTTVYAEETVKENEVHIIKSKEFESQIIKNKEGVQVGRVEFTTEVDPESFVKEFNLTATVYRTDVEPEVALEKVVYEWADPNVKAEEDTENNTGSNEGSGTEGEEKDPAKLPTYKVSGSGTYGVSIDLTQALEGMNWELESKVFKYSFEVFNIDITGPAILGVTKTPSDWTKEKVEVTVECVDNQPVIKTEGTTEGSDKEDTAVSGAGLHSMAYSFDGGVTWSNTNKTSVEENKTLSFVVRDVLGNQTTQTIEITNIDKTAPTVSLSATDEKNPDGAYVLTAAASDAESGLAEQAYSWDNGQNWNAGPEATIKVEGTFSVMVRDKVGNTATASVTIAEKAPETEDNTGSDTESGNTGSGTESGNTGSGTGSGNTGSGTGSDNTGSGTGSGNTGSGTGNDTVGNPDWDDNNHVSGVVGTDKETSETETDETSETETETDETKETETKESKETKETETKDKVVTPVTDEDDGFTFPIGLALIIAAILIVLSIIILVIKMMYDRHAAAVAEEDDEEEDMRQVYARVNKEETKVIDAAAAAKAAKEAEEKAKEEVQKAVSDIHFDDLEVEEAIGAAVTAAIATEEPVVKKIQRKHGQETQVNAAEEIVDEPTIDLEDELSIGEFAAAAVAAGVAVVDGEKEMEEAISEMEEEKAAIQASAANPTESVVIEGAHSRLIIDPETGEYTYEFK